MSTFDMSTPNVNVSRRPNGITEQGRVAAMRGRAGAMAQRSGEAMRRGADGFSEMIRSHPTASVLTGIGLGMLLGGMIFRRLGNR